LITSKNITADEVSYFKNGICNENPIIISLLRREAFQFLEPPIVDVGAGLGDISFHTFPEKNAVCLDINAIPEDCPVSKNHKRIQQDFFEYFPAEPVGTLLLSHVLQFIDGDVARLNEKIRQLDPRYLIVISNTNSDFMGKLVKWAASNLSDSNPEIQLSKFPSSYRSVKSIPFEATISCIDFESLAEQVGYLMVADILSHKEKLMAFLKNELNNIPSFSFGQTIEIYEQEK
jgi:hypothetical protein